MATRGRHIRVLTQGIRRRWWWLCLGAALLGTPGLLIVKPDFMQLGHVCSLLIGQAGYRLPKTGSRGAHPA